MLYFCYLPQVRPGIDKLKENKTFTKDIIVNNDSKTTL